MFKKIDHIEIVVSDLYRAINFYKKLGSMIRQNTHHGGSVEFLIGNTIFEIHKVGGGGKVDEVPGIDHISFLVEGGKNELEVARKKLLDKGIECTEVSFIKATGRYLFNFRDADGHRLQTNTEPDLDKCVEETV